MSAPQIESYRFGHILIDGRPHDQDVIILPDRVLGRWWRKEGHLVHLGDLNAVFEAAPELLIVGQGAHGRMQVAFEARKALRAAGIELVSLPTEEACQMYNAQRALRTVAAALHLTC
jgi:hypothetical protein